MEYDKNSKVVKYQSTANGQTTILYYASDAFYTCQNDSACYKYPINQSTASGFSRESYEYSQEELADFKNGAAYQGTQPCPAGSCDVWKVSTEDGQSTIYIDKATKRISQVEGTTAAGSSKIVYEYKDVNVSIPPNAQELPSFTP
jgi:hypothetical protein